MRSSPQITSTVSGMMSSSRRMSFTRRLPATSTSRRGFLRMTFMPVRLSRAREPGRALDLADLREVDPVVVGLQLPPLGEIEIAEADVLERQWAWIDRREPLDRLAAALARGAHRRDELGDRLAVLGPDDRGRIGPAGRRRGERLEPRQIGGEPGRLSGGLRLPRELRRQLARRDLGDRQVVNDLADRPLLRARLPVGLTLREPVSFFENLGAHRL